MSDCCATPKVKATPAVENCKACGKKGRPVAEGTVRAILKPGLVPPRTSEDQEYRFCANPACDRLYFSDGWVAGKSDARVRVGVKETEDPVPLCYCFNFARADVRAEVDATGRSTIPDRIAAEVKAGNCICEVKNPSGACCLGEVRKAVKEALALKAGAAPAGGRR